MAKRYTEKQKRTIVEAHLGGMPAVNVCKKYKVTLGTLFRWEQKILPDKDAKMKKDSTQVSRMRNVAILLRQIVDDAHRDLSAGKIKKLTPLHARIILALEELEGGA